MDDATATCPRDGAALRRAGYTERCATCDGAWVHEDALIGMLQERAAALVALPWQPRRDDAARGCPVCRQPMQTANLGSVALDRCAAHGVWFDPGELAALIAEARDFRAEPAEDGDGVDDVKDDDGEGARHRGLLGALARLFGG